MDVPGLKVLPPLYLAGMKISCWKCGERMPVVTLIAPNIEDVYSEEDEIDEREIFILSDVVTLPTNILEYLQKRVPSFKLKYSKTVGAKYYANTCPHCGMLSGDFYLHSEPGAPFFPMDEEEASQLYITEIPIEEPVLIQAGLHSGTGELIVKHAQKIA
jgi:hypothetical protein